MIKSKRYDNRSNREKARIIRKVGELVHEEHFTVLEACQVAGVHHSQYYRWKKLEEAEASGDRDAWKPRSKRPKRLARKTPESVRERVVSLARSGDFGSANSIAKTISAEIGRSIHAATVISILEKEGLYGFTDVKAEDGSFLRKKRGLKIESDD
ncbi:transposase [Marinobacter qingdaonensis]|uniref:Transposase n=1 Tax=Marinobacter qingdaonensis TaxID=3108486 RepID=A0ABU5NYP0_9GAMM|nr:transposase [Marinobacter sp. ASW11-75]MEA1080857.1 transposase [Marinobacter sp. ASW11-75]